MIIKKKKLIFLFIKKNIYNKIYIIIYINKLILDNEK
jgi:hypothetical protein